MRIRVLFFGALREAAGHAEDSLEVSPGSTAGAVFEHYARRIPRLREMERSIALARNQQFSPRSTPLEDGDEIAFLPPVSGGNSPYTRSIEQPSGFFALTREKIDSAALGRRVLRPADGAVVIFEGVVRDNTAGRPTEYLEYDCYEPMAVKEMARIGFEIAATRPIGQIAMVHRLGRMEIGEASVVIAVSAPHRRPAFEAALDAIDRLKRTVPIWKKEFFADGAVWVEGDWDRAVLDQ